MRAISFKIAITVAVLGLLTALALALIVVQYLTLHEATKEVATAQMDVASAAAKGNLQSEIATLSSLVRVLSHSPFLADSDRRSEVGGAVGLFKTALQELPQADSLYVGYDNGCWLQVRGVDGLNEVERKRLKIPEGTAFVVSLVLPTDSGDLPLRRVFHNADGEKIGQLDLLSYGYDVRSRDWYRDTMRANRTMISAPYLSFSLGSPMITLSAPLHGRVRGVIAIDLKLDTYSEFVAQQRPGQHGTAIMFNSSGPLIAHPEFAHLVDDVLSHPGQHSLPRITDITTPTVSQIIREWDHSSQYEGSVRDADGNRFLFRLSRFPLGEGHDAYLLLLAAEADFGGNVRNLQIKGTLIAFAVGALFLPGAWLFGGGMSASLKRITARAGRLRTLAQPDEKPVSRRYSNLQTR